LLSVVSPKAGQEVGLQFQADRKPVVFRLASPGALSMNLFGDSQQVLHVMADFMSNDIGLGKLARGTVAVLELLEETEIEINLAIPGAEERAHGGIRQAAS